MTAATLVGLAGTSQRAVFGAGVHLAPFFSPDGGIVVVVIDRRGSVAYLSACGRPAGGLANGDISGPDSLSADVPFIDSGDAVMIALYQGWCGARICERTLRRGVHVAPWHPRDYSNGYSLVAIDHLSRLVAIMDARDAEAAIDARRELLVLLETLAPLPLRSDGSPLFFELEDEE